MKTQKNKAITLVALVITMIVLIILAAVSINMLFGENGIITKAKLGKSKFLGEDAREVVEQRVAALKQDTAQKSVDTTLYDFWFMYNSETLEDGSENKNFKDDMAIYLFTDELSAKFKPATKKVSRPADSIANCEANYSKSTAYKTAIVVYKDYVTAVDKDVVVSLNAMEIDNDSDVQTFLESANANNGGTMNASLKQAAIEQGLNITTPTNHGGVLPKEYQEVEYIESTGTQYIDTKLGLPSTDAESEIDIEFMLTSSNRAISLTGTYNGLRSIYLYIQNDDFLHLAIAGSQFVFNVKANDIKNIKKNYKLYGNGTNNYCYVKDNDTDSMLTSGNFSGTLNTSPDYLFAVNYNNNYASQWTPSRIYSYKHKINGTISRNFVPCYSTTTVTDVNGEERAKDTIGMYDTVEGKFYTNQGSGTFLKGNDV